MLVGSRNTWSKLSKDKNPQSLLVKNQLLPENKYLCTGDWQSYLESLFSKSLVHTPGSAEMTWPLIFTSVQHYAIFLLLQ